LHACEMAGELGIRTVIVPEHAGVLSALGMLLADAVRDYAAGVLGSTDLEAKFAALERRARRESPGAVTERSADLRYRGQSYELNVAWADETTAAASFHREHARLYGYSHLEGAVEVVTIRVRARARLPHPRLTPGHRARGPATAPKRRIWISGAWKQIPVWQRSQLRGTKKRGPALVADYGATTLIPSGWRLHVDRAGNLMIQSAIPTSGAARI
jgi:N-methylhydantoinase A